MIVRKWEHDGENIAVGCSRLSERRRSWCTTPGSSKTNLLLDPNHPVWRVATPQNHPCCLWWRSSCSVLWYSQPLHPFLSSLWHRWWFEFYRYGRSFTPSWQFSHSTPLQLCTGVTALYQLTPDHGASVSQLCCFALFRIRKTRLFPTQHATQLLQQYADLLHRLERPSSERASLPSQSCCSFSETYSLSSTDLSPPVSDSIPLPSLSVALQCW